MAATIRTKLRPHLIISTSTNHAPRVLFQSRTSSSSSSSEIPPSSTNSRTNVNDRLSSVIDAVNDRKLPPQLLARPNAVRLLSFRLHSELTCNDSIKSIWSETDIINVVEHRIWRSMEEGQFEKLPGKGKPLDLKTNPHADPAEDTLYRILSKNGCAPEWVELNKEIRHKVAEWRVALKKAWTRQNNLDGAKWKESSEALQVQLHNINDKVFRYNLIVPFGRQLSGLKWEKELDRLKEEV